MSIDSPDTEFTVVINTQQQYSIWPTYHSVPNGWSEVGVKGDKQTCLDHINKVWVDMRPKSLRDALAE
ncbi:MbtH family protein [Vibrio ostreicida]|uniref:MbtH family NRPS accessory protein n=1 Tax=Vibrio ostreicida TaxID=526588 RepID=A0ABT8BS18_9VIBR|nr:MbtH family NRPS accessory protein [Vibrio ostreicida]MDN3609926.1 MbtH family NRPS accessory protein [Vibrio ostreicida]NPD10356.1 MbtH family NRPS accessory protein [Vibrio ostreicida]